MKQVIQWLLPAAFLISGLIILLFVSGCGFLGILLCALAGVTAAFYLLAVWKRYNPIGAKVVQTVLASILIFLLLASAITLIPVLQGPDNINAEGEYLILLGAGVKGDTPSEILQNRIDRAFAYLSSRPELICIASGGKGDGENLSEAQCIYDHLTAMGIDGSRIWLEDRATSTVENFRYSIALIEEKTGKTPQTVDILSNEFHLYRAGRMAADCGLQAHFIAASTENTLIRISYTVREIFALWKYLLVGG